VSSPIIVIGDRSDIAASVSAMKAGAIGFLTEPLDSLTLIAAVQADFAQDRRLRRRKMELKGCNNAWAAVRHASATYCR
jgi:FixJ family two-component response regulator